MFVPTSAGAVTSPHIVTVPVWPTSRMPVCDGAMFAPGSPYDITFSDFTAPTFTSVTMTPKVAVGPTTNAYVHVYANLVDACSGVGTVSAYLASNGVLQALDPLLPASTDAFQAHFADTVGHITSSTVPGTWTLQNMIAFDRYSSITLTSTGAYVSSVARDTSVASGRLFSGPKPICYIVRAASLGQATSTSVTRKGSTIDVYGHLKYWNGRAWINRVGVPVTLQRRNGNGLWYAIATHLTSSTGALLYAVQVPASTYFRLVYAPNIAFGYDGAVNNPMAVRAA